MLPSPFQFRNVAVIILFLVVRLISVLPLPPDSSDGTNSSVPQVSFIRGSGVNTFLLLNGTRHIINMSILRMAGFKGRVEMLPDAVVLSYSKGVPFAQLNIPISSLSFPLSISPENDIPPIRQYTLEEIKSLVTKGQANKTQAIIKANSISGLSFYKSTKVPPQRYWREMTADEYLSWYPKPADRCQLDLGESTNWIQARSSCSQHRARNKHPSTLQCGSDSFGIGLGYKHNCVPPMPGRRSNFKAVLIGHEDANSTSLVSVLLKLAADDKAMVALGDSLTYQTIFTLPCELHRERVLFEVIGSHIPHEGFGNYTILFQDSSRSLSVQIHYMRLDNIRLPHQTVEVTRRLRMLSSEQSGGFVLLANIGLNYNNMQEYTEDMPKFLNWMASVANSESGHIPDLSLVASGPQNTISVSNRENRNIVLWRETTASHWSYSNNGYFSYVLHRESNLTKEEIFCSPHAEGNEGDKDPRNEIMRAAFVKAKNDGKFPVKLVHYVPFYFATKDLWSLHTDFPPFPGGHSDCVHYCYHPALWQPIWTALKAVVVDKSKSYLI